MLLAGDEGVAKPTDQRQRTDDDVCCRSSVCSAMSPEEAARGCHRGTGHDQQSVAPPLDCESPLKFRRERRIMTIPHPEGSILERREIGGVVAAHGPRKPVEPLARTIVREASQVHADHLIYFGGGVQQQRIRPSKMSR